MKDSEFNKFLADIPALSKDQHQRLTQALQQWTDTRPVTELLNERVNDRPRCPHCDSGKVQRWGRSGGLRRYRCKPCGKTFNPLTGTPLARLRKREQWPAFSETLVEGTTVQQAAEHCGVDPSTSFRWRHRFLDALQRSESVALTGIVEVAEARFPRAEKGAKGLQRPARRRGGHQHRGFTHPEDRVLLLLDRAGNAAELALSCQVDDEPEGGLIERLAGNVVLCGSDSPDLRQALKKLGLEQALISLNAQGELVGNAPPGLDGALSREHIDAYVLELRAWIQRFRGVNSRYLVNYMLWYRLLSGENTDNNTGNLITRLFR